MILVTGGTGLVGSHLLLSLLKEEKSVRALYRTESSILKTKTLFKNKGYLNLFKSIEWIKGDITETPSLEIAFINISEVYHCAGLISFQTDNEELVRKVNIEGTANIVNLCLYHAVKKLCHVSSIAALGHPKNESDYINEETEWNPELAADAYAISKYGAEMEVCRGQQEGLDTVIVNPGVIIGSGFWEQGSGKLFSKIKKGMLFYTRGVTGYVDVSDVVTCMILLMRNNKQGERYVLISENLSYQYIFDCAAENIGVKKPAYFASKLMTEIGWRIVALFSVLTGIKTSFSKNMATYAHTNSFFSNQKIIDLTGHTFIKIADSIVNTANQFKKEII